MPLRNRPWLFLRISISQFINSCVSWEVILTSFRKSRLIHCIINTRQRESFDCTSPLHRAVNVGASSMAQGSDRVFDSTARQLLRLFRVYRACFFLSSFLPSCAKNTCCNRSKRSGSSRYSPFPMLTRIPRSSVRSSGSVASAMVRWR